MAYGFYLRKKRSKYTRKAKAPATKMSAIYKYGNPKAIKRNYYSKGSFAKRVNSVIARNVENKHTATFTYKAPVGTIVHTLTNPNTNPFTYTKVMSSFVWAPGTAGIWNLVQGTSVQDRIGNKIKIKRWVIKGLIQPNDALDMTPPGTIVAPALSTTGFSQNSQVGYVDLYFGRLVANNTTIPVQLTNFYQSGSTDLTPTGSTQEQLYRVNNDLYKVYYHKRFKMGTGQSFFGTGQSLAYMPSGTGAQSNDFNMTRSFGFDITKYVLKNKSLKYDELVSTPQDINIENLCLWSVWHPATGDFATITPNSNVLGNNTINKSFYNINAMSYGEYEDA